MNTLEFFSASIFGLALHSIAPVDTLDFWFVAVPAMICMGTCGIDGYRHGKLEVGK